MTALQVRLSGCDDSTRFVMDLTPDEEKFLRRVAGLSEQASEYQCQPRLVVEPPEEEIA